MQLKSPVQSKRSANLKVTEFRSEHQSAVEELVLPIQQLEFGVPITREEQPDLMDIAGTFQRGSGNFWVALADNQVVGTIGLVDIGNGQLALKKMFVQRDYRGKEKGVSTELMNTAKEWAAQCGITEIYLGTTSQMTAAHRFYERHGFVAVNKSTLPPAFPIVHVDNKFYKCTLV